jgi:small subunit ribosomal protein S9
MVKSIQTSGKRKQAIARASIKAGKGVVRINSLLLDIYQPKMARMRIQEPLVLAGEKAKKVDISVKVQGGGAQAQADAIRLAIARALVDFTGDKALKTTFQEYDRQLLIADVRRNEPSKPNVSKPRKKRQKSYR